MVGPVTRSQERQHRPGARRAAAHQAPVKALVEPNRTGSPTSNAYHELLFDMVSVLHHL